MAGRHFIVWKKAWRQLEVTCKWNKARPIWPKTTISFTWHYGQSARHGGKLPRCRRQIRGLGYGFQATYGENIVKPVCSKTKVLSSTTTFPPAKFPDKYDRSAFSSVIDWSLEISFQNSAGQSIVFNRGRRFPIRPYGDRCRTHMISTW